MQRVIGAPTDLPGCLLWLDAQDSATVIRDGAGLVSQWSDKSASGAHAVEANATWRPTYSAVGFGGLPCLNWGATTGTRLVTPNLAYDKFTAFVVLRSTALSYVYIHESSAGGNRDYFISSSVGNPTSGVRHSAGIVSGKNVTALSSSGSFLQDSARHVVTRHFNGTHATHRVRVDGCYQQAITVTTLSGDPAAAVVTGPIWIGNSDAGTPASAIVGAFAEFIVFNRCLSEGEIVLVEQYLSKKWAIAPQRLIASPLELPDCVAWYDAAQGVTLVSSAVSQWNDLSGLNNHLTQGTAGARPVVGVGQAGLPCINFDGVDDILNVTVAIAQPQSVFVVGKWGGSGTGTMLCGGGNQMRFWRIDASSENFVGNASNNISVLGVTPDAWHVHGLVLDGVASRYTQDSAVKVRGNAGVATAAGIGVGGLTGFGSPHYGLCSVAEVVIFKRRLTDGEAAEVEAYLRRKYAL